MEVLVTGMGTLSILGKGVDAHRKELFYKVKNQEIPRSPYLPSREKLALNPPDLRMIPIEDEKKYFEDLLGLPLSRNSVLALAAFKECLAQSEWSFSELNGRRIAIVLGTTAGCSGTDTEYIENFVMDRSPDPSRFKQTLRQNPSQIIKKFAISQGVNSEVECYLINNACTSSTDAVGLGARLLEEGLYDVVFAGGADEVLFQTYYGFSSLQLVSPDFKSAPFDKNRNGLLLSEGAAILCLEKAADLKKRNEKLQPQGVLIGYESTTEVYHQTSPNPKAEGLMEVTTNILSKAGLVVSDIDFINAHATGTPSNDFSEGNFFMKELPNIKVSATKGYTGHCLGAVGAMEAIFCILSIQEKKLPATYGFQEVDPAIGLIPNQEVCELEFKKTPVAYSTSVGFGGVNSALLIRGMAP